MSSLATFPPQKKRRFEGEPTRAMSTENASLHSLPKDLLLRMFEYADRSDIAAICRVCSRFRDVTMGSTVLWRDLAIRSCGSIVEEVWHSLRRGPVVSKNKDTGEPLDGAALWRQIFASHERARQSTLEKGWDYHDITESGLPAYELDAWPEWMRSLASYSFVVHVWEANGTKVSSEVQQPYFAGSKIQLDLGKSRVGKLISSNDFHALEIEICCECQRRGSAVSALLYSSLNPLDIYGGGSFEEYSAMPWFEWDGDEEEFPTEGLAERFDWLPFVLLVPPHSSNNSICAQPTGQGTASVVINVEMQWRSRIKSNEIGDDYDFVGWMNATEILAFLKHRQYKKEPSSKADPHCFVQSVCATPPTRDYEPKSLGSYSFILDLKNTKNPAKNCSIFYEYLSQEDKRCDDPELEFEIPMRYRDFLLWGDDYYDQGEDTVWKDVDTVFAVFIIDRESGMQAKLYESTTSGQLWEYFLLSYFPKFEKCAALTQFSNGSGFNTIPVPCVQGYVRNPWKEDPFGLGSKYSFSLFFEFLSYKAGNPGTDAAIETTEVCETDFFLAFIEKGVLYK